MIPMVIFLTIGIFTSAVNISVAGTIRRVPEDYPTIQKAINAAVSGDTILVAAGTYPEYVCVNKSVTLQGTNRQSIIKGGSESTTRVVDVKISNVKISGFTVQGPTLSYKGIYVEPPLQQYFTNINITDNTVIGCNDGIFYSRSSKCFITNNTLQGNTYGIRLYDSNYDVVAENLVNASGYYGIDFYARSRYNNLTKNTVMNCKYGVLLEYANYTTMYLNTIKSNTEYGLRLSYTFYSLGKGNTIRNNKYGVYIWNCSQNQFYYNNFIDNTNQVTHYAVPLTSNAWDTDTPPPLRAKGNYWSDYTGVDDGTGLGRWGETRWAGDGVGDTLIPHLGVDWYPLMYPWTPVPLVYPVAIFTWSPLEPIYNQPATFNASKSYDVNGTIVSYAWNFGDSTPPVTEPGPIAYHTFTASENYTVTLTVTDNDGLTNSTSHIVKVLLYKLEIDVYTQHLEPYSGKDPHQPSDAFAPQSNVILYAEVTYNYEPVENKQVVFTVTDPNSVEIFYRTDNTNASGIAVVDFRLANNATFGVYTVLAAVEVSGRKANDTLTFLMGWIIEIISVKTVDQYGAPKIIFVEGEQIYFSVNVKNIAFTPKNATLTVGVIDETHQVIGVADIRLNVPPGTHEYNLVFHVAVPQWTLVGLTSAHVCAFTTWPWSSGVPYCPEISTTFRIVPD
jgi:parallel beta-helix repeat protein